MFGQDGMIYYNVENIPNLGSWVAYNWSDDMKLRRDYVGKNTDYNKLPTYVLPGSTAFAIDANKTYMYDGNNWSQI